MKSLGTRLKASVDTGRSIETLQGAAAPTPRVLWLCWVFRGYRHTSAP